MGFRVPHSLRHDDRSCRLSWSWCRTKGRVPARADMPQLSGLGTSGAFCPQSTPHMSGSHHCSAHESSCRSECGTRNPMKNGANRSGYPEAWLSRLDQGRFVSGASSPNMSLAWTSCELRNLLPPLIRGARRAACSISPCLPVPRGRQEYRVMEILYHCCAGLDVHTRNPSWPVFAVSAPTARPRTWSGPSGR